MERSLVNGETISDDDVEISGYTKPNFPTCTGDSVQQPFYKQISLKVQKYLSIEKNTQVPSGDTGNDLHKKNCLTTYEVRHGDKFERFLPCADILRENPKLSQFMETRNKKKKRPVGAKKK